ncbi:MAG: long-chain fatty acid--CoA ligase [Phycisphaerales bacterium]|nr:MAG: long-chain fatty acid--CoA ligase [Phycisphaerales bacterium]
MLVDQLLAANDRFGAVLAIDDGFRSLTYRQVTALASVMRDVIDRRTTCPRVGILLPSGGAFAMTCFGALWASRVAVPLNLLLSAEELRGIVEDAGLDAIITVRHFAETVEQMPARAIYLEDLPLKRKVFMKLMSRPPAAPRVEPDDVAVILYTSGTTGRPKGVQLSYGNLHSNCVDSMASLNLDQHHRFLNVLPPFHVFGLTGLVLMPIHLGATVHAIPRFNPLHAIKSIAEKQITLVVAIPSMYAAMLKAKSATPEMFRSVQLAISGGEPLPDSVARGFQERFGVTLRQGYGLTETSPVVAVCTEDATRDGTVGRPIRNVRVSIVAADGRHCGPGEDGEIVIHGPGVMKGYYNQPEETRAVIDEDGGFHTGDMGRLDDHGFLTISGRIKEMLIVGGENVYPREIEAVLEEHADVVQAAVIGVQDESRGEVPIAFVICRDGAQVDEAALRQFARQSLAGFKVPRQIRIESDLPTGPTGKILKRRLKEMVAVASA